MSEFEHDISPKSRLLDIDLKGIWRYRDLWRMYVRRDLVTQYKQTVLGPLWYVIQPLLSTVMYMFVFGGIAGISTDGLPQPLFYMSGILLWTYFSACFNGSCNVFGSNAHVFGKVYFPRLVVPLSVCTSNLLKLLIQLAIFIAFYVWFLCKGVPLQPNWTLALFPLLVLMLALHGMSWGLIISSLTAKYRDLRHFVSFAFQLLMYGTPVVYPLSVAPAKYRAILELNPLTPIFEAFKYGSMGTGSLSWSGLLYSLCFLAVTSFLGVIIFNKTEKTFMDTV